MAETQTAKTSEQSEPLWTVKQAAEFLQVRPHWVYRQIRLGTIPVLRFGKYRRFRKSELLEFGEKS